MKMSEENENDEEKSKYNIILNELSGYGYSENNLISQNEINLFLERKLTKNKFDFYLSQKIFDILNLTEYNIVTISQFISGFVKLEDELIKLKEELNNEFIEEKKIYENLIDMCKRYQSEKLNEEGFSENARLNGEIIESNFNVDLDGIEEIILKIIYGEEEQEIKYNIKESQLDNENNKNFELKVLSGKENLQFILMTRNYLNYKTEIGSKTYSLEGIKNQEPFYIKIEIPFDDNDYNEKEEDYAGIIKAKIYLRWSDFEYYNNKKNEVEIKLKKIMKELEETEESIKNIKSFYIKENKIKEEKKEIKENKEILKENILEFGEGKIIVEYNNEKIEEIDNDEVMVIIYRLLSKDKASDVFVELDPDLQEKLINNFTDKELKAVIDDLFMDDTVDLIEEMPSSVVKRILKNIKGSDRKIINELLKFPEDSAGSIMTTEMVELREDMTVEEAFKIIKQTGIDKETIYVCYVVDNSRKLIGRVETKDLLISERDVLIKDILEDNIISVLTTEDKETVAKMFDKYNFMAMPVVDKEDRLVGIVTIDDAIDVMQEENTEDFEKMAAMTPTDDTYFKTSVFKHAKNRIVWLLFLMLSSTFTGLLLEKFQTAIAAVPLLVSFIPTIMDTGGNCGSQSSTLIIRGLALDEIKLPDLFKAIWKEIRVALIIGSTLALVTGIRIYIQYGRNYAAQVAQIAIVVGITLMATAMIAETMGCLLPMLAKRLKLDPAIMASPLITTVVDLCSMLVFFRDRKSVV